MPLQLYGAGRCMDRRHLHIALATTPFGSSIVSRFVRMGYMRSNLRWPLLSRSRYYLPDLVAPCALALYLPADSPLAPFFVIRNTGEFRQSGRWQAVNANRHRRHNALSSLTHQLRAPSSVRAKLTKGTTRKLHRQGRAGQIGRASCRERGEVSRQSG